MVFRRAVKATILLFPLLGINNLLFLYNPGGGMKRTFVILNTVFQSTQVSNKLRRRFAFPFFCRLAFPLFRSDLMQPRLSSGEILFLWRLIFHPLISSIAPPFVHVHVHFHFPSFIWTHVAQIICTNFQQSCQTYVCVHSLGDDVCKASIIDQPEHSLH